MDSIKKVRDKKKDEKNLVWIEQPNKDSKGNSNAYIVGVDVWQMYNTEFNLTISDICEIVKCERKWVLNYIKDNVKHIFLNNDFRSFLNILEKKNHFNKIHPDTFLKDYYYFSNKDFKRWLKENTKITRQTIRIDLKNFVSEINRNEFVNLITEYNQDRKELLTNTSNSNKLLDLKTKFFINLINCLNDGGKNIFISSGDGVKVTKRNISCIDVTKIEDLPKDFTSIKELKEDKSLEMAYRKLFSYGALKYTIADSLVRYDEDYISKSLLSGDYIITIPYKLFLENKHFFIL